MDKLELALRYLQATKYVIWMKNSFNTSRVAVATICCS